MEKQKRVAVLFSSGLDSTYLIYKNLKEGKSVIPYYVDIVNNTNKRLVEKQNMVSLYMEFYKEFSYKIERPVILTSLEFNNHISSDLRFKQIPIWILNILFMPKNVNEIHIGYVAKDDAISHIDDIKKTYNAFDWLFFNKKPKLVFPLTKIWKEDIVRNLPNTYLKYISSCEEPIIVHKQKIIEDHDKYSYYKEYNITEKVFYKPCGECDACLRILKTSDLYDILKSSYNEARMIMYSKLKNEIESELQYQKIVRENKLVESNIVKYEDAEWK